MIEPAIQRAVYLDVIVIEVSLLCSDGTLVRSNLAKSSTVMRLTA